MRERFCAVAMPRALGWMVALLCMLMTAGSLRADTGTILDNNGQPVNYDTLVLHGVSQETGTTTFRIAPSPGQQPVDLDAARVPSLTINGGSGRLYNLTLSSDQGSTSFDGVRLLSWDGTNFSAIPPGGQQAFTFAGSRVITATMAEGAPQPVALPTPTPAPTPSPQPGGMNGGGGPDFSSGNVDDFANGLMDDEYVGGDEFSDDFADTGGVTDALPGFLQFGAGAVGLILLGLIVLVWFGTTIFLAIWAFKEGDILWGFLILCCTIGEILYVFQNYEGPWKPFFQILAVVKIIGAIGSRFA